MKLLDSAPVTDAGRDETTSDVTGADLTPPAGSVSVDPPRHTPLWAALSAFLLSLEGWLRSHGGEPLRYTIRGFWMLVAAIGIFLLVGPVINKPMTLDDILSSADTATERWIARDLAVEYTVDIADDGTLVTRVEERITAFFPDDVDASGIERLLVTQYQGNELNPSDIEATLNGEPLEPRAVETPTELTLTLDAGERLTGDHEFVLRYTLQHLATDAIDEASGEPVQLLEWDVLGPNFGSAFTNFSMRLDLSDALTDSLVRDPRGGLAWTLLAASSWLEPEADSPAGRSVYELTNDQNIPPNANAWFTVVLEPGTVELPPPSTWFWVQTWGPLAPLVLLALTLLFAIAARAVAWSNARGRPWYVAQSEPPDDVSVRLAARILRSRRSLELAETLESHALLRRRTPAATRRASLEHVGHAARRAGRLGDLPRALRRYASLTLAESREQYARGFRRIPHGFVRDAFIWAPIALTIVQWGVVRQLSYQVPLAVVWWPAAFVAGSTVLAAVIVALAYTAHPLTTEGAVLRQHLQGVHLYAERTQLFARTTLRDPALAHAVLLADARDAGSAIAEQVEAELGPDRDPSAWRTPDFLTAPRLAVRALALLALVGTALTVALIPSPSIAGNDYAAYTYDFGTYGTEIESFEADAVLTRSDDGRAVIAVTETVGLLMDGNTSQPGQVIRQWADSVNRQSLGLTIGEVRLDGRDVSHVVEREGDTQLVRTTMSEPLDGEHTLTVEYTLASAAVAAVRGQNGETVDRVHWVALLDGWRSRFGGEDRVVEPFTFSMTADPALLDDAIVAGWDYRDPDTADRAEDWMIDAYPFGEVPDDLADGAYTERAEPAGGGLETYTLSLGTDADGGTPWAVDRPYSGVLLDFPAGTFTGPDDGALRAQTIADITPPAAAIAVGILALALGGLCAVGAPRRPSGDVAEGLARDVLRWLAPALGVSAVVLFVWITLELPADDPRLAISGIGALAGIAGGWLALAVGWRGPRKAAGTTAV